MSSLLQNQKAVLGDVNINKEQFNSPKKNSSLLAHLDSMFNAESKTNIDTAQICEKPSLVSQKHDQVDQSFALKLNPVSEKCSNFVDQDFNISPSKRSNSHVSQLEKQISEFDEFILLQRAQLPQRISGAKTAQEQNEIFNQFFNLLQTERSKITNCQAFSKLKFSKSPLKKSPMKSPSKRSKENDENASPSKQSANSYVSPVKGQSSASKKNQCQDSLKETRNSQRRRQKTQEEEDMSNIYLQDSNQCSNEKNADNKTPLPKSPLKRMRKLEDQDNLENQENIETTYRKSPTKVLAGGETDASPINEDTPEKEGDVEPTNEFTVKEIKLGLNQDNSAKSLFGQKNQEPKKTQIQEERTVVPIQNIFDVDSNVINYGQFICGKILGSTLQLSNISDKDQVVTMNISKEKQFKCDAIFGQYNREELPFQYKDGTNIKNSEIEFNCWFIENPVSKELQKTITLKIGPQMSQEFIIVVKAPKNRLQSRIVSFIDIQLTEDALSTSTQTEKHLNHNQNEVLVKKTPVARKMDVLLLGYLDNPKIKCMKQLYNKTANSELVSLAVKKTQGIQRFKLPFKNLSSYLDSDIEFAFIRTQNSGNQDLKQPGDQFEPIDCLSFYCQPNQLKIAAEQISILTVQVKVNTDLLSNEEKVDQKMLKYPLNKLLVARLKNSQVLFSFFVSITLID